MWRKATWGVVEGKSRYYQSETTQQASLEYEHIARVTCTCASGLMTSFDPTNFKRILRDRGISVDDALINGELKSAQSREKWEAWSSKYLGPDCLLTLRELEL
jgi:hypothetical protein